MNASQTIPPFSVDLRFSESAGFETRSGVSSDYPRDKSIAALFEEVASRYSDRIALSSGNVEITYGDLDSRSSQLADRLRHLGVAPEMMVACFMDRSIEYIIAILAILKAGGAYVPIDPSYPTARLTFLLDDTKTPLLLTNKGVSAVPTSRTTVISMEENAAAIAPISAQEGELSSASPTNLAYVMYTSGSTGQPKGVLIENRGIVRLVRNTNYCHFGADETFLQLAPLSFDASTFEIWGALLNGARLVIMPPGTPSTHEIATAIREYRVTTMWLTAPLFHLMVEQEMDALASLRQLLAGGDVLSPLHVRTFLDVAPDTTLINGYGPTENTTFTCCNVMRHGDQVPEPVPIGKPISNTRVYILDEQMRPVAPGDAGELCAAGDGLARGYLNQPDATAAKFVPDPFAQEPGQRLYRTGDRARWRTDGSIDFLGRMDAQIKILGHRIEPGEIEAAILKHDGVKDVCVVAHTDSAGHKRLVGYFVATGGATPNGDELRRFIASRLPQHMIPAFFIGLDALPLSFNGKVDRDDLSKRPLPSASPEPAKAAPASSNLESTIAQLWRSALQRESVGLDENFFDLGGDSLLLVTVHSKLQKSLNKEISLTDLFEHTTIRGLAAHLNGSAETAPKLSKSQERAQQQRQAFHRWRERRWVTGRE